MRVTDKMGRDQVTRNLQKNRTEMTDLQNQAATQKRVNKPSDDPVAAARVLGTRSEDRGSNQFMKNINYARSFLEYSDQSLGELADVMVRLKELAIGQANDAGASAETRRVVAEEVNQVFSQTVQLGNRKLGERFVFGGFKTTTTPFSRIGEYNGDDGDMYIPIDKDATVAMNVPGNQIFLGKGISQDGLIRPHAEPPKTADELDEFRQNEEGRKQDVKDSQTAEITLRGPASIGERKRMAVETVSSPEQQGGVNIFGVVKGFEIALRTNDKEEIQESIDRLDQALSQVILTRAQVGARIQHLNRTQESLQKSLVDNKLLASQMEDADLFQVVSDITKTDSALKATLETSGKILQPSLLDFLK